jgi:hypothetical protein
LRRPDRRALCQDAALRAVEVKLSLKGARRLEVVCCAWARRAVFDIRPDAPLRVARRLSCRFDVRAHDVIHIVSSCS